MIIDASDLIVGRLGTFVAKKALLGEDITIINCEEAVISGNKKQVLSQNLKKRKRGTYKGPIVSRRPDFFVRRMIRGMLPYKKEKGALAYKRIKCYVGSDNVKDKKIETVPNAHKNKLVNIKSVKVKDICKLTGGKV